jgi:hypothetical protein
MSLAKSSSCLVGYVYWIESPHLNIGKFTPQITSWIESIRRTPSGRITSTVAIISSCHPCPLPISLHHEHNRASREKTFHHEQHSIARTRFEQSRADEGRRSIGTSKKKIHRLHLMFLLCLIDGAGEEGMELEWHCRRMWRRRRQPFLWVVLLLLLVEARWRQGSHLQCCCCFFFFFHTPARWVPTPPTSVLRLEPPPLRGQQGRRAPQLQHQQAHLLRSAPPHRTSGPIFSNLLHLGAPRRSLLTGMAPSAVCSCSTGNNRKREGEERVSVGGEQKGSREGDRKRRPSWRKRGLRKTDPPSIFWEPNPDAYSG